MSDQLHIAIDASCWWNQRGFGRFTRGLLPAMLAAKRGHRFSLLIDRPVHDGLREQLPGADFIELHPKRPLTEAATADSARSPLDLLTSRRAVARLAPDLVFFPAVYSWFPVPFGTLSVVTIHDAIAEHFPKLVFPGWRGRLFWSLKMHLARWQARRFISVSVAAREEIVTYMGINPQLIDIVGEAADPIFAPVSETSVRRLARQRAGLPEKSRLLLYVGGLAPHKNLSALLKAMQMVLCNTLFDDLHLALVGDLKGDGFHSHSDDLMAQVEANTTLKSHVHFTGFVSDDDLVALYSDALALVLPSFSEGFGLPVIEAMACGTPVLVSRAGSLPELAGNAALYFDPHRVDDIAAAITRIATDTELRNTLRKNAAKCASRHSWQAVASQVLDSLERTARAGHPY